MQATTIPNEIQKLIKAGALFVSNHSGGKDSQATLIELLKWVPKSQIIVVHASLGRAEWPGALEKARDHAEKHGLPFFVAQAGKTFFGMVTHRFTIRPGVPSFPNASSRQCTSDLKRDPIAKVVRRYATEHGYRVVVNCLGLRAAESTGRAKMEVVQKVERFTTLTRTWIQWLPIHTLETSEVFEAIKAAGEELHYAYSLGNERLSCVFCIMSSTGDLKCGQRHNPELFSEYVALEKKTGYTMHVSKKSLTELVFGQEFAPGELAA